MSNNNQVISCGAVSINVNEHGHITTSVDVLANGIKNVFSKQSHHGVARRETAQAHI